MAATFCNPNHGCGLDKLNHHLYIHNITRSYPLVSLSGAVKRSLPCCCHSTERYFSKICIRRLELEVMQRHRCRRTSSKSRAEHSETSFEEEKEEDIPRATLMWRAIKLPIYSVALVPLTVGSAAAYLQTGLYLARRYFVLLASSVLVIAWLNLSNDVYDFDTGADMNKKESVVNIVGSRTGTLIAAYLLLALGFMGLAWASVEAKNMRSILLLASAITCGYIYQSSTSELPITGTVLSVSLLVGFTTSTILFCSHFHQVKEDRAVGKMSPLVRLGTKTGSEVVKVAVITLYSLLLTLGLSKALPFTCVLLCALTLPMGKLVVSYVEENHEDKTKIFMAKYYCVRLHAIFGAALAAGLVAARMVATSYVPKSIFP